MSEPPVSKLKLYLINYLYIFVWYATAEVITSEETGGTRVFVTFADTEVASAAIRAMDHQVLNTWYLFLFIYYLLYHTNYILIRIAMYF